MGGAREIGAPPEKQDAGSERCKERSEHRLKSRTPEVGGAREEVRTA